MADQSSEIPASHASGSAPVVVAERAEWRVVSKPAGWHCVARAGAASEEGGESAPTVEEWLRTAYPEQAAIPEAGIVHRLDLGTSGCLVVARNVAAYERLRASVGSAQGTKKTYLALVAPGMTGTGSFRLYFVSRHKGSRKVTVRREGDAPECGRCRWQVIKKLADGAHDLVEVELVGRGRRHQIRAGLAYLGHPLVGDALYGGSADAQYPTLHAWRVELDGETVECPPPTQYGE